ncbi:MAG: AI-2E family transporter [Chloroflexi bacterium]|nr:AI-2E family transporter [Chloroflexota bacterium]
MKDRFVKIAPQTIALAIGLLLLGVLLILFLHRIRFVLVILALAIIFAQAVEPFVTLLQTRRIRRGAAVVIVYLAILLVFAAAVLWLAPPIVLQAQQLIINVPALIETLQSLLVSYQTALNVSPEATRTILQALGNMVVDSQQLLSSLLLFPLQITYVVIATTSVLVISFYWMLVSEHVAGWLILALPSEHRMVGQSILRDMGLKVGDWVRGQVILSTAVGLMTFLGLVLLGQGFAVILAVWAAVTELIPIAGPIIGAIPAVFLALLVSPWQAVLVAVMYLVVQQIEAHLLVPNVMYRQVGLHPLVVILSLLVGGTLLGIVGALLAVPVAAALQVLVVHLVPLWLQRDEADA